MVSGGGGGGAMYVRWVCGGGWEDWASIWASTTAQQPFPPPPPHTHTHTNKTQTSKHSQPRGLIGLGKGRSAHHGQATQAHHCPQSLQEEGKGAQIEHEIHQKPGCQGPDDVREERQGHRRQQDGSHALAHELGTITGAAGSQGVRGGREKGWVQVCVCGGGMCRGRCV